MLRKYIAGAIQLDSTDNYEENIRTASELIAEGAARGAKLLVLPETWTYMGKGLTGYAEEMPGGRTFQILSELARRHQIWLHCGTYPEVSLDPDDPRIFNTSMLLDPQGQVAAKYTKIHNFKCDVPGMKPFDENRYSKPGDRIVVADTELGQLGMSICFDFRFPELYRLLAVKGAELFIVSSAVMAPSGRDHWKPILQARAIENSAYVIATNQCGMKRDGETYGHTMILNPWGTVLAEAGQEPCVITAEIDLDWRETIRRRFCLLENRRDDVYRLETTAEE